MSTKTTKKNRPTAADRYEANATQIAIDIQRLMDGLNPEAPEGCNWADVGDIASIAEILREAADRVCGTGEYAAQRDEDKDLAVTSTSAPYIFWSTN